MEGVPIARTLWRRDGGAVDIQLSQVINKEYDMNAAAILSHAALAALLTSVAVAAQADGGPALGKTRAQVRAEVLQAGEEGMLPLRWVDYPPSAATRARNRENYLRLEQAWKAEGIIPATSVSSSNGFNEEQR
jgi:hypothetical protein